ncbi:hypothetical protein [Parendozoicomonas sp. Alg238-R29]|uniref:hypothetical protein n=1 Tax=Parendozoicomonas sp. Alg238-R29 TaxID=2993446 RepID=UPI00248D9259|nr:hypothetical protein [Parendozoicomonas sp. Alg238-R29]
MNLETFLIAIPALIAGWIAIYSLKNGIGPVPTNRLVKRRLFGFIPDKVSGDIFELGAGWGGVSLELARHYPAQKVIAVENSLPVWLFCWLRARISGLNNLEIRFGDIYQTNLKNAGMVYCYLYPKAMIKLAPQLQVLPAGCVLISNTFSAPGMEPESCMQATDLWKSQIYCYRF